MQKDNLVRMNLNMGKCDLKENKQIGWMGKWNSSFIMEFMIFLVNCFVYLFNFV